MSQLSRRHVLQQWAGAVVALGLALTGAAVRAAEAGEPSAARRPNILILITDDNNEDEIGCFNGGRLGTAFTPNLDRLAAEGMKFTQAHVPASVCCPSRYALLTGRYAGRCQARYFLDRNPIGTMSRVENDVEIEPHLPYLTTLLKQAGYVTAFVGKSHLWEQQILNTPRMWPEVGLRAYARNDDPRDPAVTEVVRHNHDWWRRRIRKAGFDFADRIYCANLREIYNDALNVHNLEWTVQGAHRFLDHHAATAKDKPFFLYFATTLPHGPAPWEQRNGKLFRSLDADPRMSGAGYLDAAPDVMPSREQIKLEALDHGLALRDAWTTYWDHGVGSILRKLEELGHTQNTLVLFVSDHGTRRHGKTTLYDNGLRVPMIARWPGVIAPGRTTDALVSTLDWVPTILAATGIAPPPGTMLDGRDIGPLLRDQVNGVRASLFGEIGYGRCVKTRQWKYIAVRYPAKVQEQIARGEPFRGYRDHRPMNPYLVPNPHLGYYAAKQNPHYFATDQLYDLEADPAEESNVADQHPAVLEEMKAKLAAYLAQFPDRPFGEFTTH